MTLKRFVLILLFLLVYLIELIQQSTVKQACETYLEAYLCGDACLENHKTCHCGNSSFIIKFRSPRSNPLPVCCSPGNCTKDSEGNLYNNYQRALFYYNLITFQEMAFATLEKFKMKGLFVMDSVLVLQLMESQSLAKTSRLVQYNVHNILMLMLFAGENWLISQSTTLTPFFVQSK